ncbi:MAG TPA: glycolate oxidase subunit GlcF [Dokdonella sp.]
MHTKLAPPLEQSVTAHEAEAIVRRCVHCGFCLATCPTYQVLGDERDSPRGRIYLIQQLLEGAPADATTQTHLDRCLGCRACETTCPSGVRYGALLDYGRGIVEAEPPRPPVERLKRAALLRIVPSRRRFGALLGAARALAPLLPARLRAKLPPPARTVVAGAAAAPSAAPRRMLALDVCGERTAAPNTRAATERVFARLGIALDAVPRAGCCGALAYHMGRHEEGLAAMRRNIDAWWPALESGAAEAIVATATGCALTLREYGHLLRHDADYAEKARRVAALVRDPAEIVADAEHAWLAGIGRGRRIAFHAPCTLQHGLRRETLVEGLLREAGYELAPVADAHLCCGSAGSYSLLQPALADTLRTRKLAALEAGAPEVIATANVGCQLHLAAAAARPVRHWIELIDAASLDAA